LNEQALSAMKTDVVHFIEGFVMTDLKLGLDKAAISGKKRSLAVVKGFEETILPGGFKKRITWMTYKAICNHNGLFVSHLNTGPVTYNWSEEL
jgi:hypothetical protein